MYERPIIPEQVFRDARGEVIPYGHRWGTDGPPADTYSVTAHPERFAPLHDVARALTDALGVEPVPAGPVFGPLGPQDALRFDPPDGRASPIVIALTDFPGVRIRAGAQYETAFPVCGCDACDDDVLQAVGDLEQSVFAIVEGRFWESARGDSITVSTTFDTGSSTGNSRLSDAPEPLTSGDGTPLAPQRWAAWDRPIRD